MRLRPPIVNFPFEMRPVRSCFQGLERFHAKASTPWKKGVEMFRRLENQSKSDLLLGINEEINENGTRRM